MNRPTIWTIVAIIIILIGTGLLTYSGVCVTVEKNGKKRSVVHGVYIAIGVILIAFAILIFILISRDLGKYTKIIPGMAYVSIPEKFGNWLSENMKGQMKFTKVIGNHFDNTFKSIKGINRGTYKFYGSEPGSEGIDA